uniref:putative bifunctional diguanylate cyclase/phosphodiesterase n=1 Tax=Hylemonella sp. TaxID=2066020 RepID=UPI0035AF0471
MFRKLRLNPVGHPDSSDLTSALLRSLSYYIIPLILLLASLVALFFWEDLYTAEPERALELRVLQDTQVQRPEVALARLRELSYQRHYDTKMSELPVWFSFKLPEVARDDFVVEVPSRHARKLACWNAETLALLGSASAKEHAGGIRPIKSGYALTPGPATHEVVCEAAFIGPARLGALLWTAERLDVASSDFHRQSGWLDGGMLVLALFVLVTAFINRRGLYVLFAAWLLLTLRISATSAGWDFQWLNHAVPEEWISQGRSLTRAAYAVITITLFRSLFKEEMEKVSWKWPIQLGSWLCLAMLPLAFLLPRSVFIYSSWALGGSALLIVSGYLIHIVARTQSRVALWYAGSMAVTFLAGLYEIIAAAFGLKEAGGTLNSVIAVLASCLLAAFAIAEQMRVDQKQKEDAQAQLQHTYDTVPIGMFTLDLQGRFTSINPALRRMLGPRAFKSEHNTWQQYFGADIWHQLLDLVQNRQDGELEIRSQMDITGYEAPRRYLVKAALSGDKIEGSLQDVTEKSMAAEELNFLADNDALTKVLNRRGVEKAFYEAVANVDEAHPLALAYLDLDRFKLINDLYGHNAGDEVLRQVCHRVNVLLAAHMKLGRVGGDEFVILLPDTRMPLATVIARGIIENIDEKPFRVGEKAFYVRGSIGLIEVSPGSQFKEVLSTSDRACREAKSGQHRGLVVYEQGSPAFKEHQAELRLIGELSASDSIDGLYLEMQPIMSLTRPSDALNFEVLLRMRDAAGELLPVNRVIAAAEDSGRMSRIDHWVLTTTLAWLDQHRDKLQRTQFVCINLSGASLNDEQFMQEVFGILRRNSHVSSFLTIEITESVALHDLKNTRRFIDKVRGYGARVALDDFGAGYTSFSYLKELPADLLKIDGSFVVNMNQHPANVSIVEAIVNLARNLGMKTIAEWAEDSATVQALSEIGVDYVQGYAVARPMAPEKLLEVPSAAGFIKDVELMQFVDALDRQNNPLAQLDLLMDGDKPAPPKIH